MFIKRISFAIASVILAGATVHAAPTSQYAGQEGLAIKALSASDVADLLAGKGMGFAKAAELNGYPGPAHVLELSSQLKLSEEQIAQTQVIFQRMEGQAKSLGAQLVEAERELDGLFRSRTATPELLASCVQKVSALQAKVRGTHLLAHIEQTRLLSEEQVARYVRLRGYSGDGAGDQQGHHQRHQ